MDWDSAFEWAEALHGRIDGTDLGILAILQLWVHKDPESALQYAFETLQDERLGFATVLSK
jgi:hypothetical protein